MGRMPVSMKSAGDYGPMSKPSTTGQHETETSVMDSQQGERQIVATAHTARRACLVEGCPCKDARIVSHRRAAFYAAVARRSGETADRIIAAEDGWRIPTFEGA